MAVETEAPSTRERLLSTALQSFAGRGYEATSLDDIAEAAGVRKQTLLYYHPSKEALLGAVIERVVEELEQALRPGGVSPVRLERVVDALFRVGARRPELLDLVREALRLGPPASTRLNDAVQPLVAELAGTLPREAVLTAAAIVVGMATEVDVLRGLGVGPTVGATRRRRRVLLDYLRSELDARART